MFVRVSRLLVLIGLTGLATCLHAPRASAIGAVPTGFTEEEIWSTGVSQPAGFTFLPDGRVLFTEQRTRAIKLVTMTPRAAATILTVADVQIAGNEQGLLGIAVDPGWQARPYIYVYFDRTPGNVIYIRRYNASGSLSDPTSLAITLASPYNILTDIPDVASNHNGGTLHFGPDGMLYASLGDDDPHYLPGDHCAVQDVTLLMGKIIRLDISALPDGAGGPPAKSLITPPDNPFIANPNANAKLVYNLGLRNPFRFTIDPATNDLYIGDVGENAYEEYDQGQSGDNLGWPRREGLHPYGGYTCGIDGENPIAEYAHAAGSNSVMAGPRYRTVVGPAGVNGFPTEYEGSAFFAEYYGGWIRRIVETSPGVWALAPVVPGQPAADKWATGLANIGDIQEGPDGAIWYLKQFSPASLRRIKGTPSASVGEIGLPSGALAVAASPNPGRASSSTSISFTLPAAGRISIGIFDLAGARVATVFQGRKESGSYQETWNGVDASGHAVAPGIYFVRLESAGGASVSSKIALVR